MLFLNLIKYHVPGFKLIQHVFRQHHHGAQTASVYEIQASLSHLTVALKIKKEPAFAGLLSPVEEDSALYPIPMTGYNLSQNLNIVNCSFDLIKGSARNKEVIDFK